jgi:hypothetical protein
MNRVLTLLFLITSTQAQAFGICWPSCTQTTELDERTVAVTARGSGLWSVGLNEDLMAAAATASLQHGFSKFRLLNPNEYTNYAPYGFFNNGGGFVGATRHGQASAIARFFNANEPGSQGALDAQAILNRYGDD